MSNNFKNTSNKDFKFRSLRVYASTEWLADNKKKYRQVFYKKDVSYLYIEFAITNKKFEEENWDIALQLKCFRIGKEKKQICNLTINRQVNKYDDVVFIREGWGNKEKGSFWKKGKYVWEAWVEQDKVGSKYIYIEDIKDKTPLIVSDYISLDDLYFYEGSIDNNEHDPTHLVNFSAETARYIYANIHCINNHLNEEWIGEFILRYINEARELKGEIRKIVNVKKGEENIGISGGWGSNVKGSWKKGMYHFELIFMEKMLVQTTFEISEDIIEGDPIINTDFINNNQKLEPDYKTNKSAKEIFKEFHGLVGLSEIKRQIHEHTTYISFLKLRKERGYKEDNHIHLHSIFSGNPGTGKTTVANLIGSMYKSIGMLKKGHVHVVDRADLVGEFIGQTAPKVKAAIEEAKGGVLFIDEAYALARNNDDNKDFGKEVIEILVKSMGEPDCDFMVIAAGYPDEMEYFVRSNPGLKSRFRQHFKFKDYSLSELFEIVHLAATKYEVQLSAAARSKLEEIITKAFRNKDKHFGNARFVYDLIEKTKVKMGLRLMSSPQVYNDTSDIESILLIDVMSIDAAKKKTSVDLPIDEALLKKSLQALDGLIGLESIKKEVNELVEVVRFHQNISRNPLDHFNFHSVLIGNPGTGKTTVARILSKIFKALGLLEKGHLVEVDRKDLIAGYVGQSAIKTSQLIDKAIGGVLFIDEAYALTNGHSNDFGGEVIQTLLKRMEDDRGKFFVFAAGYTDNMKTFLKSNPGLSSRFDRSFEFHDFAGHQLNDIALLYLKNKGFYLSTKAATALNEYINNLFMKKDKYFGNARVISGIMVHLIKSQNYRLSKLKEAPFSNHVLKSIILQDVEHTISSNHTISLNRKSNIGFARNS
ncbi:MAG: AAA family ATPase [Saprospiraceae bacterium]